MNPSDRNPNVPPPDERWGAEGRWVDVMPVIPYTSSVVRMTASMAANSLAVSASA